ncbi:Gfo/Idh/MocA family oxidoreductase [uncultured Sphingomonas sp.]|uniref:Gfo/Idh/MocA family protein n=1 Tax=uncultured Sphingomonas sp. TaxID=158754 RepID=UPI002605B0BA|nr:Gfo/Idh/MocA family oxidoreductase [uncultured Sphingomonas sp.]
MKPPHSIAIIGAGKIAQDQHLPAIAASDAFSLAAVVDPALPDLGVPAFATLAELIARGPAVDAVAVCTPPLPRTAIVREAIAAGLHVLMEKPPAATLSEVAAIEAAVRPDRTVYASWHSRHAPMVAEARAWLAGRTIRAGRLVWREDAHRWHPGQHWLWQPGGMGVFDPTINAFSILTEITDAPWSIARADFQVPAGLHAPISAQLAMRVGDAPVAADLHFHDDDTPEWTIALETDDGAAIELRDGGSTIAIDGAPPRTRERIEYPGVYAEFAALVAQGRSAIDVRPLRLVADAFLLARVSAAEPFAP